jgi:enediyne biosynthesis protein E4
MTSSCRHACWIVWRPAVSVAVAALAGMSLAAGCGTNPAAYEPPPATASKSVAVLPTAEEPIPAGIQLVDATAQSGITFRHDDGASGEKYLVEPMSAGLALFDYDGDGLIDIYFANGAPLPPLPPSTLASGALYRNEGDFRFRDVTTAANLDRPGFGLGAATADFDNDGDADLYVSQFGQNVLYRNNGDGTFTEVTKEAGVRAGECFGAGVAWLDADADGDLDLFSASYVAMTLDKNPRRTIDGFPSYPGPRDFAPAASRFFVNRGDGTFLDASEASGIASAAGAGMGVIAADYDNDRDTDLLVANDELGNFLFENDGTGKFVEVGIVRGFAYGFDGRPRGSMGIDCADYNHDGWLDFFVTTYSNETCVLFRNERGRFEDATTATGAGAGSLPHAKWGTCFADFDNDADCDLFLACGHLDREVHSWKPYTAYRVANLLLENIGGKYEDISDRSGSGLTPVQSSRGVGLDDLDNDGRVDLVVLNATEHPTVIRNESRAGGQWLQVELCGRESNRDGIGAQVRVTAGGRSQLAEVHSGRGYQSHYGTRLHFGLGRADHAERIEVRWIGGGTDVLADVAANQRVRIVESTSTQPAQARTAE